MTTLVFKSVIRMEQPYRHLTDDDLAAHHHRVTLQTTYGSAAKLPESHPTRAKLSARQYGLESEMKRRKLGAFAPKRSDKQPLVFRPRS